jgi:hypothetical protein
MFIKIRPILIVSFFTFSTLTNCATPNPIRTDKEREIEGSVIPVSAAKELLAKHTDNHWVENPYLDTTVEKRSTATAQWPKSYKIIKKYKGKKPVDFIDLVMYPHPSRKKCIVLALRGGRPFDRAETIDIDENTYEFIDIHPKIICTRSSEEREDIIDAIKALGADYRRRI